MAADSAPTPEKRAAADAAPPSGRSLAPRRALPIPAPLARLSASIRAGLDHVAENDARRLRAALAGAFVINAGIISTLAIFGRVQIWVPNRPSESISIVFADILDAVDLPELETVEMIEVPAPEPEAESEPEAEPDPEPEIVEEPEILPEPDEAPEPEPEAAPEAVPEPVEEPEPAPPDLSSVLDLTPEPRFTTPDDEPAAPNVIEPAALAAEPAPETAEESGNDPGNDAEIDRPGEDRQSPAPTADPLVEEEAADAGFDVAEDPGAVDAEMGAGDDATAAVGGDTAEDEVSDDEGAAGPNEDEIAPEDDIEPEPMTGDDMFDEAPSRFLTPRNALPLPTVDLPPGEALSVPGDSGVIAIFCPEAFDDKEKQAECAGRTEIRSGWRPGASGEDFTAAARLLQRDRGPVGAGVGNAPATVLSPGAERALADERLRRDLTDPRRDADSVNNLPQTNDNLGSALGRPDIGPDGPTPGWSLREDPLIDQDDIEDLEKALEEAERNR